MDRLTQWIAEHPIFTTWVTLISILGFVISIVALIIQLIDRKRCALHYAITSTTLVDEKISKIDGLRILFHDIDVQTVVVSNIKLWNGGNELLEPTSYYRGHSLKLVIPEKERILIASIIDETSDTCEFRLEKSFDRQNELMIDYSCLEPHQGATLLVYHTNTDETLTKLAGKLKGGKISDKSIRLCYEEGDIYIHTNKHKIWVGGGLFGSFFSIFRTLIEVLGINIKKR